MIRKERGRRKDREPEKEFASAEVFKGSLEALMRYYFGEHWEKLDDVVESLVSRREELIKLSEHMGFAHGLSPHRIGQKGVALLEKLGVDVQREMILTVGTHAYKDKPLNMGMNVMDCLVLSPGTRDYGQAISWWNNFRFRDATEKQKRAFFRDYKRNSAR